MINIFFYHMEANELSTDLETQLIDLNLMLTNSLLTDYIVFSLQPDETFSNSQLYDTFVKYKKEGLQQVADYGKLFINYSKNDFKA